MAGHAIFFSTLHLASDVCEPSQAVSGCILVPPNRYTLVPTQGVGGVSLVKFHFSTV